MRHLEAGGQSFRRRGNQTREGILVPVDEILLQRLALHGFLAVARRLFRELQILDDMLRRLGHDPAAIVEPFAPGASADLMKIPRAQDAGLLPSNLQKRVKNTVRIGTLIPTSSVSVPQMTLSNPF